MRWLARDACPSCHKDARRFGQDICDDCCRLELETLQAARASGQVQVGNKVFTKGRDGKLRPTGKGKF